MNPFLVLKKLLNFFKQARPSNKLLGLACVLLILVLPQLGGAASVNLAQAGQAGQLQQEIERVRKERETLLEEQRKLLAELEAINKQSQSLGLAVKSLDVTKKKLNTDISVTKSKITSTNLTIRSLESTMGEKERQVVTHRKAIAGALSLVSEYDSRPIILDVLASAKFSDIWNDRDRLDGLNVRLEEEINNLRETRKILTLEKEEKEKVKEEQLSLQEQLSGQKSVVEENQKAKERLLAETKNKEVEYQRLLAENIANQKQFEEDLYRLESELKITLDPSLIPTPEHSVLAWPLDNIFVTQRFGDTAFARGGAYNGKGHNGIDFRASMGTPVKSMLAGTVEGTGNTDEMNAQLRRERKPICGSYGRWILVKHNNGLSSVYAHLSSSIVKAGQNVKTGEVIGYSGGTPGVNGSGYSTGPHLHVGLFASQGVQISQFTTSKNCKHTFVPIADFKAYMDPLAYLPSI
ncbi:MAG: peptidoglycan DD-metalloendopeptidase family protein [bacterium]|nr:peptidoglycan DD-metalloendopeptidase family protein [bacterium]